MDDIVLEKRIALKAQRDLDDAARKIKADLRKEELRNC